MNTVVKFESVSKQYSLGQRQEGFREMMSRRARRAFARPAATQNNHIMALNDVSFQVTRGEVLGLIGTNGAGKTTALKLLSRVTHPTSGRVEVHGRVSALIELGAGFHPDLTGRENIYLNGAILGLSQREIRKSFDAIVAFAELEEFLDTPVKRYSSGMYARLAFAVAAHTDPDLMLVDEVLAVGDINFQKKCYDFVHRFVSGGHTAVFVSHNMYVFEQLCSRVLWLDKGRVLMSGDPAAVLSAYLDEMDRRALQAGGASLEPQQGPLRITSVRLVDGDGRDAISFTTGDDIVVEIRYEADGVIANPFVCVSIAVQGGSPLLMASMLLDGHTPGSLRGSGVLRCRWNSTPLLPKVYEVWTEVWGADRTETLVNWQKVATFRIAEHGAAQSQAARKGAIRHLRADAPIKAPYRWEY